MLFTQSLHFFPYYYYYYYYLFLYSRAYLVSSQPSWVTLTMKKRRSTKHDGYLSIVIIIINSSYINGSHLPKKFIQSIVWTNMYKDLYHFLVVFLGIFFDFSIMGNFSIKTQQSTLWKKGLDAWGRNPTKTCMYYDILFLERSWEDGYKWPEKCIF